MASKVFSTRLLGPEKDVLLVSFNPEVEAREILNELQKFYFDKLRQGQTQWLFDLSHLPFPTNSIIAFFISATQQARRAGGDVKFINVKDSANNNFLTFNPLSYLSLEENEHSALVAFGVQDQRYEETEQIEVDSGTQDELAEPDLWDELQPDDHQDDILDMSAGKVVSPKEQAVQEARSEQDYVLQEKPETSTGLHQYHLRTESLTSNLYKICDFVVKHAETAGLKNNEVAKIKIAVYEACLNVIEHAYHSKPDNWIDIHVEYNNKWFKIVIQDYGLSFDKPQPKEYDVEQAVSKRQTGGFGLHIIQRSMDIVDYVADPIQGNKLTLMKKLDHKHGN